MCPVCNLFYTIKIIPDIPLKATSLVGTDWSKETGLGMVLSSP